MERRLAAILAADMVGFSRLMEADEIGTLTRQKRHRAELIDPRIEAHGGKIIKLTGDGMIAEFPSVVEAVQCAVTIQREMDAREADEPEDRRIRYRIAVNLGDVIFDEGDVYGDGVNIAARLEAMADPGGVLVSGSAYDQLKANIDVGYEDLGEKQVKNISAPVRVYRVLLDGSNPPNRTARSSRWLPLVASLALAAAVIIVGALWWWPQPEAPAPEPQATDETSTPESEAIADRAGAPSIAVLAFDNLSGDPAKEYFSDGFTEDLIIDLSKLRDLVVIARNSSFAYKGKATDIRQIGRELDVGYVMEGSVRHSSDQLRVTAQLIDASTGDHVWAQRYDRPLTDVFAMQDEIRDQIVAALDIQLTEDQSAQIWRTTTTSTEAYDLFLRARELRLEKTKASHYAALDLLERALEIDPDFAAAWALVSLDQATLATQHWTEDRAAAYEKAKDAGGRAIELYPSLAEAYTFLGSAVASPAGRAGDTATYKRGISLMEKGSEINPNSSVTAALLAIYLVADDRAGEAREYARKAMRLNPNPPDWYLLAVARAELFTGHCEEAIEIYRKCVARLPDFSSCQRDLTAALMTLGRTDEARAQAREVLRISPNFTVSAYGKKRWESVAAMKDVPDPLAGQCVMDDTRKILLLYKAGIPE